MKKIFVFILFAAGIILILKTVPAATIKDKIMRTPGMIASDMINASAKKLELRTLSLSGASEIFTKKHLLNGNEKRWQELYDSLESAYNRLKPSLQQNWGLEEPVLKAAFLLASVTNMWSVGSPGMQGVSVESFFRQDHKGRIIPVSSYVKSPYADCNDFATMLFMLLRLAGFEARHVGAEDHIYVEAVIDNKSYIMDATYGFFTQMSHAQFLNQGFSKATYFLVPYNGAMPESPLYRPRGLSLRMAYMITRGRILKIPAKDYSHWDEFKVWLLLNGTEIDGDIRGLEIPKSSNSTEPTS